MTAPELENFRTELIQTAAVCAAIIEDIDNGVANHNQIISVDTSAEHGEGSHHTYHAGWKVLDEISAERDRQDEKWGPQHHDLAFWMSILGEEVGEAFKALNDDLLFPIAKEDERIGTAKPIKWRKPDADEYGKPTTMPAPPDDVLVERGAARLRGEYVPPLVVEIEAEDPADELKGVFDRLREEADDDQE